MDRKLWNPDDLDQMRMRSDPIGDRVIASFGDDITLATSLLDSLVCQGEPTPETSSALLKFREQTRTLPSWANHERIRQAQTLLSQHLIPGTILLAAASLPQCYLDWRGTPVLATTSQLTTHVFRRLIQTSHMVFTVQAPGSLFDNPPEGGAIPIGIHKAQTVRLIHALMRHLLLLPPQSTAPPLSMSAVLLNHPSWDITTLGVPINQEDEAFVLLTFSYVVIEGFGRLRIELEDDERDAIIHLWSVVGYVMGIHEGLLAHSHADAAVLYQLFRARLRGASEAGQRLVGALIEWINSLLPRGLRWFDAGAELINFFNGHDDARLLGVGHQGFDAMIHGLINNLIPASDQMMQAAGQPHPWERLVNMLAQKMVDRVWKETQSMSRTIDWPNQVEVAATASIG